MALEATLTINAKDNAGTAFNALKKQIEQIDAQVAVFDRLAKQVGNVGPGADKLARSISEMSRAMQEQRAAAVELASGLEATEGAAGSAAAEQARLRASILETNRVMAMQGGVAERAATAIQATGRKQAKEAKERVGMGGGLLRTMLGFEAAEFGVKAVEGGATLDQALAKLRTTGVADTDIAQARAGYADFSKTHGGMTEAEYLTSYGESRTMSSDPLKTTREMALFTTALRNSGIETSPDEAKSFVKAMDELSLSPAEQEKFLDRMVKVKQLYGGNITGETFLAAQRRSSMAAYGWNETFRENFFPFMLQSLGVTGGNDIMTAYSNYIGKHMQHTEMMNLAKYGFIQPEDEVLNKVGDIKGLKPGAHVWEESVMKANPAQWAWDMHNKFMGRKGATEDQFTTFVGTLPRAMGAMIEFFTHGEGLAARDLALGKHPIGLAAAGNEYAAQNPVAALTSLRASIEQFGAALTAEPVKQAGAQLVALSQHIADAATIVAKFEKEHPGITKTATSGAEVVGGVLGLGLLAAGAKWLGRTVLGGLGLGGLFGRAAAGAVAGGEAGSLGGAPGIATGAIIGALLGTPQAQAGEAVLLGKLKDWVFGPDSAAAPRPYGPQLPAGWAPRPQAWTPSGVSLSGGADNAKLAAASAMPVSVTGHAEVDHTVTIRVEPSPLLNTIVEQARAAVNFNVPLIGGGDGRMDSDAGPHRSGGIGHQ